MVFRRFNRGNALRPVNRIKHVIDSQVAIAGGASQDFTIVNSVTNPELANIADCEFGSTVNGIFIVCEGYATSGAALANLYFMIFKNPGGNLVLPAGNVVGGNDNKKYVFHQEMVMLQEVADGNPRTLFKGVIAVPKAYRRNGPNDTIIVRVTSPGVNVNVCLQAHYKEFR